MTGIKQLMDNTHVTDCAQDDAEVVEIGTEPQPKRQRKRISIRAKFNLYQQAREDARTPFTGHDSRRLRAFMDISVKRLADLANCKEITIYQCESTGRPFSRTLAVRFHRIRRYAELAKKDLRDRFEMPDFNR